MPFLPSCSSPTTRRRGRHPAKPTRSSTGEGACHQKAKNSGECQKAALCPGTAFFLGEPARWRPPGRRAATKSRATDGPQNQCTSAVTGIIAEAARWAVHRLPERPSPYFEPRQAQDVPEYPRLRPLIAQALGSPVGFRSCNCDTREGVMYHSHR
jgi:hypothetical protein